MLCSVFLYNEAILGMTRKKEYSRLNEIPLKDAAENDVPGVLVLEGGAFRGMYTAGVLDVLMEEGILLHTTVGISAGALCGMNYISGNIGRSAVMNLRYRHDSEYVGLKAYRKNKGIIGFDDMFFGKAAREVPFNESRAFTSKRDFLATVSSVTTGKKKYVSIHSVPKKEFYAYVQASASMPLLSKPIRIGEEEYLDGGCADKIGIDYPLSQDLSPIVVVRTRDRSFRKKENTKQENRFYRAAYKNHPEFLKDLENTAKDYNQTCDRIDVLEKEGKVFVFAPEKPVGISRLEGDLEKLGALYFEAVDETRNRLDELKKFLSIE